MLLILVSSEGSSILRRECILAGENIGVQRAKTKNITLIAIRMLVANKFHDIMIIMKYTRTIATSTSNSRSTVLVHEYLLVNHLANFAGFRFTVQCTLYSIYSVFRLVQCTHIIRVYS